MEHSPNMCLAHPGPGTKLDVLRVSGHVQEAIAVLLAILLDYTDPWLCWVMLTAATTLVLQGWPFSTKLPPGRKLMQAPECLPGMQNVTTFLNEIWLLLSSV